MDINKPARRWPVAFGIILTIILVSVAVFQTPLQAQTPPPVTTLPLFTSFRDIAIAVATPLIPESVQAKGSFSPGLAGNTLENYVIVTFVIPSNVTRQELGWQEGPGTEFENTGYLPFETFNELSFKIDGTTGALILKKAADRFRTSGVTFRRTPPNDSLAWALIAAVAVAVAGLVVVLLIMHRRRSTDATP